MIAIATIAINGRISRVPALSCGTCGGGVYAGAGCGRASTPSVADVAAVAFPAVAVPHWGQNFASSESWAPHAEQNAIVILLIDAKDAQTAQIVPAAYRITSFQQQIQIILHCSFTVN